MRGELSNRPFAMVPRRRWQLVWWCLLGAVVTAGGVEPQSVREEKSIHRSSSRFSSSVQTWWSRESSDKERIGKQLEWVPLVPPPRVYSGAPAGQVVTKVQANDADGQTPTYGLLDIKDFSHFSLSPGTGELRTAKPVDRAPGDFYNIVVVAMVKGKQSQLQFSVAVVRRNSRPPSFELSAYRAETHVGATPGSRIAVLRAEDPDDEGVVYAVEGPGFRADPTTGDVALTEPLETPGIITLTAVARDGGSPPLETRIPLHVAVKTISEPREVRITATNGTAAEVCWERPAVGQVAGYLLQYRDDSGGGSQVNLTTSSSTPCLALSGLSEWRPYELQIHAWNPRETGLGSPVERFTARPQVCADHPCGSGGDCKPTRSGPPGYKCHCHEGYFGLSCEKFDSCALAPCRNFGSCRTSSSGFTCVCPAGFGGPRCEDFNPCQIRSPPCQNGGTCLQSPDSDYTCFCAPGFYGKLCESFNPCFSSPCANNATCQNTTDGEYLCLCQPGYQGEVCEIEVDECQCSPCLNGGDCKDGVNSFHCECPSGYHGKDCSERDTCSTEVVITDRGTFSWNATSHGTSVALQCPYGPMLAESRARRRCLLVNGSVYWSHTDDTFCREKGFQDAEQLAEQLRELTEDPDSLSAEGLRSTADRLDNEVLRYAAADARIGADLLAVISNVMDINATLLEERDANGSVSDSLMSTLDKYAESLRVEQGQTVSSTTPNVAVKVSDVKLGAGRPPEDDILTFRLEQTVTCIRVPPESLQHVRNATHVRIAFISYRSRKLHRGRQKVSGPDTMVLAASLAGVRVTNLSRPVEYSLPSVPDLRASCVYWDSEAREWSDVGILTNQTGNVTRCYSTHLTAFSVLFDPYPSELQPGTPAALSILSYVGCSLSLAGLGLTALTYGLFKWLRRDRSGRILLHLCAALALLNAGFLAGALWVPRGSGCTLAAAVVHASLLASLGWMAVEAAHMYHLLVHVFSSTETHFMFKRCLLAWGLPVVLVTATVLSVRDGYQTRRDYCMVSPASLYVYYGTFVGPCAFILLINFYVFCRVGVILCSPRMGNSPKTGRVSLAQVRGAFTVMVLLGITWVFGAFMWGDLRLPFQYAFCIFNSLQGFLIFVIRCLNYPEARAAWMILMRTGQLRSPRALPGSWCTNSSGGGKMNDTVTSSDGYGRKSSNAVLKKPIHERKISSSGSSRETETETLYGNGGNMAGDRLIAISYIDEEEDPAKDPSNLDMFSSLLGGGNSSPVVVSQLDHLARRSTASSFDKALRFLPRLGSNEERTPF